MISKILCISKENLFSFIKFGIVGTMGLVIDFTFNNGCLKNMMDGTSTWLYLIGFCTAVINNYYFNRVWTFKSSEKKLAGNLLYLFWCH